ncbi:hypothetical protein CBL_05077 [Carabus blaptoides fortunei]
MNIETNTKPTLKIAFLNANGVDKQKLELEAFAQHHKLDAILLNETHLRAGNRLKMANYASYRNDRQRGPGGGTAILVKRSINHYRNPTPTLINLEATTINLELPNNKQVILTAVYNPPDRRIVESDLDQILDKTNPTIVAGDLNAKHQSWNSRTGNQNGKFLKTYADNHRLSVWPYLAHSLPRQRK